MSHAITRRGLIRNLLPSLIACAVGGESIAVARSARRKVRTVAELIEAMGGTEATAEWAGVDRWWIDEWSGAGGIPTGWHYRLDRALAARGYEIDEISLGFNSPGFMEATSGYR